MLFSYACLYAIKTVFNKLITKLPLLFSLKYDKTGMETKMTLIIICQSTFDLFMTTDRKKIILKLE